MQPKASGERFLALEGGSLSIEDSMKQIEFKSNYGKFAYVITATIGTDVNEATVQLCLQGLANLGYRVGGSSVDKALEAAKLKGEKDSRASVEYSEAAEGTVNAAMQAKLAELREKEAFKWIADLDVSFAPAGMHVPATTPGESKEAKELWAVVKALDAEGQTNAFRKLGLEVGCSDAVGVAAVHEKLKAAKQAAKAAAMAGMLG